MSGFDGTGKIALANLLDDELQEGWTDRWIRATLGC